MPDSTNSSGPGRLASLSFRSSASRARFSSLHLRSNEGAACGAESKRGHKLLIKNTCNQILVDNNYLVKYFFELTIRDSVVFRFWSSKYLATIDQVKIESCIYLKFNFFQSKF